MRVMLIAASAAILSLSAPAWAEGGAATGAVGGAVTGAIVGGPVGAAVGGVAGAVTGAVIDPPPAEVRTYVTEHDVPSVAVEREVVVGQPLPETVEIHKIPNYDYEYAIVNHKHVIVDPQKRTVIQVIN